MNLFSVLQHFENKLFQTTEQTLRHNMACVVTSLPCSRTSSPADLPALIPVKLKEVYLVINGALCPNVQIQTQIFQYTQQGVLSRPYGKNLREKWFKAARRDMNVSPKSDLYCCEDHFKLSINYLARSKELLTYMVYHVRTAIHTSRRLP
jgi:hypothetical protein